MCVISVGCGTQGLSPAVWCLARRHPTGCKGPEQGGLGVWALDWLVCLGKTQCRAKPLARISQLWEGQSLQSEQGPEVSKHQKYKTKDVINTGTASILLSAELTNWVRNGFYNILEGEEAAAWKRVKTTGVNG